MLNALRRWSRLSVHGVYAGWRHRRTVARGREMIAAYAASHEVRKLHIGAGGSPLDDWCNTDLEPLLPEIAFLDAADRYPIADASFDYVYSEHVFEHLDFAQQRRMLLEVLRILKPGGTVRIATPNLDVLLALPGNQSPLAVEYRDWAARVFFPETLAVMGDAVKDDVFVINNYFYSWGHRFIHNPRTLRMLLEHVGARNIRQSAVGLSDDSVLLGLERHGTVIPAQFNALETMVFEATR